MHAVILKPSSVFAPRQNIANFFFFFFLDDIVQCLMWAQNLAATCLSLCESCFAPLCPFNPAPISMSAVLSLTKHPDITGCGETSEVNGFWSHPLDRQPTNRRCKDKGDICIMSSAFTTEYKVLYFIQCVDMCMIYLFCAPL